MRKRWKETDHPAVVWLYRPRVLWPVVILTCLGAKVLGWPYTAVILFLFSVGLVINPPWWKKYQRDPWRWSFNMLSDVGLPIVFLIAWPCHAFVSVLTIAGGVWLGLMLTSVWIMRMVRRRYLQSL